MCALASWGPQHLTQPTFLRTPTNLLVFVTVNCFLSQCRGWSRWNNNLKCQNAKPRENILNQYPPPPPQRMKMQFIYVWGLSREISTLKEALIIFSVLYLPVLWGPLVRAWFIYCQDRNRTVKLPPWRLRHVAAASVTCGPLSLVISLLKCYKTVSTEPTAF